MLAMKPCKPNSASTRCCRTSSIPAPSKANGSMSNPCAPASPAALASMPAAARLRSAQRRPRPHHVGCHHQSGCAAGRGPPAAMAQLAVCRRRWLRRARKSASAPGAATTDASRLRPHRPPHRAFRSPAARRAGSAHRRIRRLVQRQPQRRRARPAATRRHRPLLVRHPAPVRRRQRPHHPRPDRSCTGPGRTAKHPLLCHVESPSSPTARATTSIWKTRQRFSVDRRHSASTSPPGCTGS
jgi:hypothetical protein